MKSGRTGRKKKAAKVFFGERSEGDKRDAGQQDRGEQREEDKKRQRQVRYFQGNREGKKTSLLLKCLFAHSAAHCQDGFSAASCLSSVWGGISKAIKLRLAPCFALHLSTPVSHGVSHQVQTITLL